MRARGLAKGHHRKPEALVLHFLQLAFALMFLCVRRSALLSNSKFRRNQFASITAGSSSQRRFLILRTVYWCSRVIKHSVPERSHPP